VICRGQFKAAPHFIGDFRAGGPEHRVLPAVATWPFAILSQRDCLLITFGVLMAARRASGLLAHRERRYEISTMSTGEQSPARDRSNMIQAASELDVERSAAARLSNGPAAQLMHPQSGSASNEFISAPFP